jgi:predicted DNA-binding antitoxin AbrB/MazE fold protein
MSESSSSIKKIYINGEQVEKEITSAEEVVDAIKEVAHTSKTGVKETIIKINSASS